MSTDLPMVPKPPARDRTKLASIALTEPGQPARVVGPAVPKPAAGKATPKRLPATRKSLRATTVTMPATLHDSLRERAQTTGSTIAGVVIEAITQQLENLSELVVSEHNTPATNAPTGPFPDPIAPKGPRVARESLAVVNLRVTAANLKVIDDLVTQHKAASRSQLVTAALRATL